MIEIRNLIKRYGDFTAVDDVSLDVARGEIFGFLGPNGAGKTTTIRILAGLSLPTSGTVRINGLDVTTNAVRLLPSGRAGSARRRGRSISPSTSHAHPKRTVIHVYQSALRSQCPVTCLTESGRSAPYAVGGARGFLAF